MNEEENKKFKVLLGIEDLMEYQLVGMLLSYYQDKVDKEIDLWFQYR